MPQDAYVVERLVISIEAVERRETGGDEDALTVGLWFKNPLGSPGSTRRPPGMELRDDAGFVYEPANDDWAEPILPDTEARRDARFRIAHASAGLELVFAPGQPEETAVAL